MKIMPHSVLFAILTLTVTALPTRASLITGTDPAFGANSLTVDTQTGLAWLNLSYTAGLSYNETLADMQPGGMFSDYSFASPQQIDSLYADAGFGPGTFPLSTPAIPSLISLLGSTETINGEPGFIAISGTTDASGGQASASINVVQINGVDQWVASDGNGGTSYGGSFSDPSIASFLVTTVPVPEPGVGSIGLIGFISFAIVRRMKSPSNRRQPCARRAKAVPGR